jgi:phosphoribosylcarboxyaminoimidazole (NCAIR) mutase
MATGREPRVGVIMGSDSDWPVMQAAGDALAEFDVPFEVGVYSAHRTPQRMLDYAADAADRGIGVIVAGAGGAAHLDLAGLRGDRADAERRRVRGARPERPGAG